MVNARGHEENYYGHYNAHKSHKTIWKEDQKNPLPVHLIRWKSIGLANQVKLKNIQVLENLL